MSALPPEKYCSQRRWKASNDSTSVESSRGAACCTRTIAVAWVGGGIGRRQGGDLPDAEAAVAAVLLEHSRSSRLQTNRESGSELVRRPVQVGVAAPARRACAVQDL